MPTRKRPMIHGRDHDYGGADPARTTWEYVGSGGGSADSAQPPVQRLDLFGYTNGAFSPWSNIWRDTALTMPGYAYLNNYRANAFGSSSSRTATDGDDLMFRVIAGPTSSIWGLYLGFTKGPDYGRLGFQIASVADSGGELPVYDELSWLTITNTTDLYAASAGADYDDGSFLVKFNGAVGAPATAITHLGGSPGYSSIDGGPGTYALRVYVNGRNDSSSGFKAGLWNAVWLRVSDTDGLSPS